jgi:beta-galactosidase
MRILRNTSAALLLCGLAAWCAESTTDAFFPVAVWYSGGKARAPMLERIDSTSAARWGKDLDAIQAAGFNTVKTWLDWATGEPQAGHFSFANLDLLLRLAEQRHLHVIVQVYLDSAPNWVGQRYPDARFVDRSGTVIDSQTAPGYCIDHPGVRQEIVKFLSALSEDANRYNALAGWDVWSEPHVINWAEFPYLRNPEFCYCPNSQARFRNWLKRKYGTLGALNAAWYRGFTQWQQVAPPRYPTILSYTDYIDWRNFITDKLAGDLKTRTDAVRTADHAHPITSHAAAPGLFTSPTDGYGEPDDWKMSANADFFGTSLYPKHSQSTQPWSYGKLAAGLDFTRSAGHSLGKGFWIGELQAGQGATGMRIAEPVTAQDEQFWMWQVVAHGARELAIYAWYPMSSGFESNGYGLINLDGSLTERARAAGKVAKIIEQHSQDLLTAHPSPAQVAILYNRLSYMVGGSQPSLSKLGSAEPDSLMGLYRAFFEQQIPVDFVEPQDLIGPHSDQYKIVFVPYPVMLSKQTAEAIKQFVANGGTTVAEARLAWNDERGFASDVIPGFGLDEVFGAREKMIRPEDRPQLKVSGSTVPGAAFEEELTPYAGSRVLGTFTDGQPAIVAHSYGKGHAILIGTFAALEYYREPSDAAKRWFIHLARDAGVTEDVTVSGGAQLEVRRLVNDTHQTVFVFNHGSQTAECALSIQIPWTVERASDLNDDKRVAFEMQDGRVSVHKTLPAHAIWVFELDAKR